MNAKQRIKLGISDKISLTVIAVGVLGLILVYYTSIYYRDIAYEHHQRSLQILATIEIEEIIDALKTDAANLARAIAQQPGLASSAQQERRQALVGQLDEQFHQYFVTANIIDLASLHVFDAELGLIAASTQGFESGRATGPVCSEFSQQAQDRTGAERLRLIAGTCIQDGTPMFVLISPFGGLKPEGYIQVSVYLASSLRQLESALGMPIRIQLQDGTVSYESSEWADALADKNHLPVVYELGTHAGENAVTVVLLADMTQFNQRVLSHRNWVMALATLAIAATVALILYLLQSSTIGPLAKIHRILGQLGQDGQASDEDNRVLFAQLLEHIITLQKATKQRFAVMILDLDNFEAVNRQFGHDAGTGLLQHIGARLAAILRHTDIVSWAGTDTPGHKLLPAGTRTEYRATLARLGGDEFGMLLPTVENEHQAISVAERIIDRLDSKYTINNQVVSLRCRIGISIYPDHGEHGQELIRNADKAMLAAKRGGGKYCIYSAKTL